MRRLAEGVYRLEAAGFVNAYLVVGDRDLTLVDAGPARRFPLIVAELKANGYSFNDVGRVVVTHAHADHAGGLHPLLSLRPVKVYAHPLEAPVLAKKAPMPPPSAPFGGVLHAVFEAVLTRGPVDSAQPADSGTPVRGLPQWQVLHTPGHTPGSISLYEPVRQILLCGDALAVSGGKVRAVPDGLHADPEAARRTVAMLGKMDVDILGCGHGEEVRGGAFRFIEKAAAA
ncbi:MBL fold metallo-hydrolase [bacterium]|nr:MAG: MBL fold metallo-hydrolase [bacterium]